MSDEAAISSVASHVLTWLVANGTSIGAILQWVTKPLRDRIASILVDLTAIDKRLKAVEDQFGDPRSSSVDIAGPAELTRRVSDLEHDFKALLAQMNRTVSDEEFRGYIAVANQKGEKLLETLAFIRGRMKHIRVDDE